MTTVPFLQRLAPAVTQAPSAVRASLPPRFAPQPVGEADPIAVAAPAAPVAAMPVPAEPIGRRSNEAPAPTATRTLPQRDSKAAAAPVRSMPPVSASPVNAAPLLPRREAPSTAAERPTLPLGRNATASIEPAPPQRPSAPTSEATPIQPSPQGLPIATARPPLSPAAVAQRTAPQATPAAPVIHVTIDRLDVRLPATAPAPKAAPKPRSATSTLPLADYLRQRRGEPPR